MGHDQRHAPLLCCGLLLTCSIDLLQTPNRACLGSNGSRTPKDRRRQPRTNTGRRRLSSRCPRTTVSATHVPEWKRTLPPRLTTAEHDLSCMRRTKLRRTDPPNLRRNRKPGPPVCSPEKRSGFSRPPVPPGGPSMEDSRNQALRFCQLPVIPPTPGQKAALLPKGRTDAKTPLKGSGFAGQPGSGQ